MPERIKTVKVDFFQVQLPASAVKTFEQFMADAAKLTLAERAVQIGEDYIRLETTTAKDGVTKGGFGRIRMNDLPEKAAKGKKSQPIDLASDEGVVERAAFLYHEATRVLLLQRSRFLRR